MPKKWIKRSMTDEQVAAAGTELALRLAALDGWVFEGGFDRHHPRGRQYWSQARVAFAFFRPGTDLDDAASAVE